MQPDRVLMARIFATAAHAAVDQYRPYTGEPYHHHLAEVVDLLEKHGVEDEGTLAAAWLHDVVEDTAVTLNLVEEAFGDRVGLMVQKLTDLPPLPGTNREERKTFDLLRLVHSDGQVQAIKCADLLSNMDAIVVFDPSFARVCLPEMKEILVRMRKAPESLRSRALEVCLAGMRRIGL